MPAEAKGISLELAPKSSIFGDDPTSFRRVNYLLCILAGGVKADNNISRRSGTLSVIVDLAKWVKKRVGRLLNSRKTRQRGLIKRTS